MRRNWSMHLTNFFVVPFQFFPDLTICKVSRLNTLYTSTLNYSKYISDTMARKTRWPLERMRTSSIPNVAEDKYDVVWSYFLSKDGYYNSLPLDIELTQNEEARNSPFIVYCYASMWDESKPVDCYNVSFLVWHRKYYKCRSIRLPDSLRRVRTSLC